MYNPSPTDGLCFYEIKMFASVAQRVKPRSSRLNQKRRGAKKHCDPPNIRIFSHEIRDAFTTRNNTIPNTAHPRLYFFRCRARHLDLNFVIRANNCIDGSTSRYIFDWLFQGHGLRHPQNALGWKCYSIFTASEQALKGFFNYVCSLSDGQLWIHSCHWRDSGVGFVEGFSELYQSPSLTNN